MKWVKDGTIRNNVQQSAGWLIIIGALEYNTIPLCKFDKPAFDGDKGYAEIDSIEAPDDWKCGAFEPSLGIHGDIEYLYVVDLSKKTVTCYEEWTDSGEGTKVHSN